MMEVEGIYTEVFECSERKEASAEADPVMLSSTLSLAPLVESSPSVHRSQPIRITSNRYETPLTPLTEATQTVEPSPVTVGQWEC